MTMKQRNVKYNKTVELLRKSKPVLDSSEDIEQEVIRRISSSARQETNIFPIIDLLFGWTNIVLIRRSLIAASVMLVTLFIYQQSMIMKQLNRISSQIVFYQERPIRTTQPELVRQLKLLKISGRKFNLQGSTISEEQMEMLPESIDKFSCFSISLRSFISSLTQVLK